MDCPDCKIMLVTLRSHPEDLVCARCGYSTPEVQTMSLTESYCMLLTDSVSQKMVDVIIKEHLPEPMDAAFVIVEIGYFAPFFDRHEGFPCVHLSDQWLHNFLDEWEKTHE